VKAFEVMSLTGAGAGTSADDVPSIGVGMLGYASMGKAHSHAYRTIPYMTRPPLAPRLVSLAGRSPENVAEAARRYGFAAYSTPLPAAASRSATRAAEFPAAP
jgi:predicted dehydrogenase